MNLPTPASRTRAFSLVEMLTVMVILGILSAVSLPALVQAAKGSALTVGGQALTSQISLAVQEAVAKNRDVEVRFYDLGEGGQPQWRAIQVWRWDRETEGVTARPMGKVQVLPDSIRISQDPALSPLLDVDSDVSGVVDLPGYGKVSYLGFKLHAQGRLNQAINDASNYLTLVSSNTAAEGTDNYYTIQVDRLTGRVAVFRP